MVPAPRLLRREAALFAALQAVFLLWAGLGGSALGAIGNALVLVVLATLRGGFLAGSAVAGYFGLLGVFFVLDHYSRTLSAYPVGPGSWLAPAVRQAGALVLPPLVCLCAFLLAAPPLPYARITWAAPGDAQASVAGYRLLALAGALAASGLYLASSLLRRRHRTPSSASREGAELLRGEEESIEAPPPRRKPVYSGARGRIVRCYLDFLAHAERRGHPRLPSQTPQDLLVEWRAGPGPLSTLTDLFMRARYGPDEPSEGDVRAAALAAHAAAAGLPKASRSRSS